MTEGFNVMLSNDQASSLKEFIYEVATDGINQARKEAGLERPFLKGKQMCEYLGISWGTFMKMKKQGLPTIVLDTGMEMYSKESVKIWLMGYEVK